jgi:hypothetical protein
VAPGGGVQPHQQSREMAAVLGVAVPEPSPGVLRLPKYIQKTSQRKAGMDENSP